MKNDFKSFFQSLSPEQQEKFAAAANTSAHYIRTHLVYGRKTPQPPLMNGLAAACDKFKSGISREELLVFFYNKAA